MFRGIGMYRAVTLVLIVLLVSATVLSGFGMVGFSPLGILVTWALATAGTFLGSVIGAFFTKARLHLESSVITGALIASIVPPTLEVPDLIGATSAGIQGGIAKFLFAPGGRHLLNPAATGVAMASAFGLTVGFWWVATPALLPVIVLGGALIAWRSGMLTPVIAYLTVAYLTLGVRLVGSGEEPLTTLWLMVSTYPVAFLGLFMLTEPLTAPIRRWQQLLVAGVVGLGVALPFSLPLGPVILSSSPELALITGNLVAGALLAAGRQRRSAGVTIVGQRELAPGVREFTLELDRPVKLLAGQWVELHLPHRKGDGRGQRRVLSISSLPTVVDQKTRVTFATRFSDSGSRFKSFLADTPLPLHGRISQVGGDFLLPSHRPLLLIAGGIGITPFVGWVQQLQAEERVLDVVLVRVSRSGEHLYPELDCIPGLETLSVESSRQLADVNQTLSHPLADYTVALSGSPGFIRSARTALRRAGAKRILTDSFTGY